MEQSKKISNHMRKNRASVPAQLWRFFLLTLSLSSVLSFLQNRMPHARAASSTSYGDDGLVQLRGTHDGAQHALSGNSFVRIIGILGKENHFALSGQSKLAICGLGADGAVFDMSGDSLLFVDQSEAENFSVLIDGKPYSLESDFHERVRTTKKALRSVCAGDLKSAASKVGSVTSSDESSMRPGGATTETRGQFIKRMELESKNSYSIYTNFEGEQMEFRHGKLISPQRPGVVVSTFDGKKMTTVVDGMDVTDELNALSAIVVEKENVVVGSDGAVERVEREQYNQRTQSYMPRP